MVPSAPLSPPGGRLVPLGPPGPSIPAQSHPPIGFGSRKATMPVHEEWLFFYGGAHARSVGQRLLCKMGNSKSQKLQGKSRFTQNFSTPPSSFFPLWWDVLSPGSGPKPLFASDHINFASQEFFLQSWGYLGVSSLHP